MWAPWNNQRWYTVRINPRVTPALARSLKRDTLDAFKHPGTPGYWPNAFHGQAVTNDLILKAPLSSQNYATRGLQASNVVVDLAARMAAAKAAKKTS
jgi:hypothetical protein